MARVRVRLTRWKISEAEVWGLEARKDGKWQTITHPNTSQPWTNADLRTTLAMRIHVKAILEGATVQEAQKRQQNPVLVKQHLDYYKLHGRPL